MGRYSAFISYSHADTPAASWLHRALESYRVPKAVVGADGEGGKVQRRLKPAFRDRDELAVSTDLGAELRAALMEADHQIVICSERAAQSKWVNEEILAYKRMHGEKRTYALIVGGEPYDPVRECFPLALRFALGADGELSDIPAEPIAADMRPGKDGRRLALLKLIAGVTGARLDSLVRRDEQRRRRRLYWIASGSSSVALVTAGLAVYANTQRVEANRQRIVAESQRQTAEASLDFLIGTFKIANPATENPRTISAVTLLNRVSDRVKVELRSQPAVSSRLLRATGEIYSNLGLPKESERDLRAALALTPGRGEARATTLIQLATIAFVRGDIARMKSMIDRADRAVAPEDRSAPILSARIAELRGILAYQEGKYSKSVGLLRSAQTMFERVNGTELDLARLSTALGTSLLAIKQYPQADQAFARAEVIYTASYGPLHTITATSIQNRALGLYEANRLKEASARVDRAVKIYTRVLDPTNPTLANAELLQGRILHARGDYLASVQSFAAAKTLFANAFGAEDYRVGDTSFFEAGAWSDARQPRRALASLEITKKVYDTAYGPLDPDQVELLKARAQVHRAAGHHDDAARDCAAAIALQRKLEPKGENLTAVIGLCNRLLADPPRMSLRFAS